jgi:hypothetical protein
MLVTIYREREAAYMLRSLLEGPRHVSLELCNVSRVWVTHFTKYRRRRGEDGMLSSVCSLIQVGEREIPTTRYGDILWCRI